MTFIPARSHSHSLTVLFADDEMIIRRAISRTLENLGYHVLLAASGEEACQRLEELRDQPPDVVITDVDMPGCGGRHLGRLVRERFGAMNIIYTSGKLQPDLLATAKTDPHMRFLEKPYSREDLTRIIHELCDQP